MELWNACYKCSPSFAIIFLMLPLFTSVTLCNYNILIYLLDEWVDRYWVQSKLYFHVRGCHSLHLRLLVHPSELSLRLLTGGRSLWSRVWLQTIGVRSAGPLGLVGPVPRRSSLAHPAAARASTTSVQHSFQVHDHSRIDQGLLPTVNNFIVS